MARSLLLIRLHQHTNTGWTIIRNEFSRQTWKCCFLQCPDMTFVVDWWLQNNFLSICAMFFIVHSVCGFWSVDSKGANIHLRSHLASSDPDSLIYWLELSMASLLFSKSLLICCACCTCLKGSYLHSFCLSGSFNFNNLRMSLWWSSWMYPVFFACQAELV